MGILGYLELSEFLKRVKGDVVGQLNTDGKIRYFSRSYVIEQLLGHRMKISRSDGKGDVAVMPEKIPLTEELVAFLGLYSGDGAKGDEYKEDPSRLRAKISFSQRETNITKFALRVFRQLFGETLSFTFSIGEDAAYFIEGPGNNMLIQSYGGSIPDSLPLGEVRPRLNAADERYLKEKRMHEWTNEEYLAFYYQHKTKINEIIANQKRQELIAAGINLRTGDRVLGSVRRPFKKGAREHGGSSRADEINLTGVNGLGELFLKIMCEVESTLENDSVLSPGGLVRWIGPPSKIGEIVDVERFFSQSAFGKIGHTRPSMTVQGNFIQGFWPKSRQIIIKKSARLSPLFCYASGLYLAEGDTPKSEMLHMFANNSSKLSLGFGSSEDASICIVLKSLSELFLRDEIMDAWKIKVGSQYFPELVLTGLKEGVPMLRGGKSGDGKLRTVEISLAIKKWALETYPSLRVFETKYSHVEPTGAGVARAQFWASSSLARWYFPLVTYAVFHEYITDPEADFT